MNSEVICAICGKKAPGSARFCQECGHALTGEATGKENAGQELKKKELNRWMPVLPLFILSGLCLIAVFLAIRGLPPAVLASGLGTIAAVGKPTQTASATPPATPSSTPTPTTPATPTTPPATSTPTPPPMPPAGAKKTDTWVSPVDGMTLIYIPADQYMIGSLDSDPAAWIAEKPLHKVDLSGYWMDKTLVTNAMYARCVQAGSCPTKIMDISYSRFTYFGDPEFDDYPVVFVTWDEAQNYCAWAGRRLPTEAEWEVAAKGKDGRKYPWGNAPANCSLANFGCGLARYCTGDTTAVGKYPWGASPYGVLDMAGNVWEWVADWNSSNYLVEPHENPQGPATGELRVIRGGAYFNVAEYLRTSMRTGHAPGDATDYIGFRCAR